MKTYNRIAEIRSDISAGAVSCVQLVNQYLQNIEGKKHLNAFLEVWADEALLRAAEIDAQAILKGTHSGVDGVYTADPKKDPNAVRYDRISHMDVITKGLKVMDSTAITFCMDKNLPIVVFDLLVRGNVKSILRGEQIGTLVG